MAHPRYCRRRSRSALPVSSAFPFRLSFDSAVGRPPFSCQPCCLPCGSFLQAHSWQDPDAAEIRGSRISFVIAVASLGGEGEAVRGRIRVSTGREGVSALRPGDEIRFSGRIRKIRNFRNPGGFDYARFMAFRDIHCSAHVRKGSLEVLAAARRDGFRDPIREPGAGSIPGS